MENKRKLMLYISMSIDGFLATKNDELDWLSVVDREGEDYGYTSFTQSVDTYIVGRVTYDTVIKLTGGDFPQAERFRCYVITRESREAENGVEFYNGDLEELICSLKREKGKHIYCDGGGQIVQYMMFKNLIDEYIVSIIPVVLGDGKRLFLGGVSSIPVKMQESKHYDSGLVQLRFSKDTEVN